MSKRTRDILIAGLVLLVISAVCVALLSVANNLLKYKPTLNAAMAVELNKVCPTTAEGDAQAARKCFDTNAVEQNFLDGFNNKNGRDSTKSAFHLSNGGPLKSKILAVYRVIDGDKKGHFIVQSQSKGRDANIVLLIAYSPELVITKATVYDQKESYWNRLVNHGVADKDGVLKDYENKRAGDEAELAVKTGASISLGAINKAVTLADKLMIELNEKGALSGTEVSA